MHSGTPEEKDGITSGFARQAAARRDEDAFFGKSTSESQGITGFLKHRFGEDHFIGSILTLGFIATSSQTMVAGHKTGDPIRKWASGANILQNGVFFTTERGGNIPQGKNAWDRMVYSLMHPNESSMHFNTLTATPISIVQSLNHIHKGLPGLESGANAEQSRLFQGLLGLLSTTIIFSGLFRMKQEKPPASPLHSRGQAPDADSPSREENKEQGGLKHIRNVVRHAWSTDIGGATARTMNAAVQVFQAIEGINKKRSGIGGGDELLRGAAVQLAIIGAQFYYLYDRLLQDSHPQASSHNSMGHRGR